MKFLKKISASTEIVDQEYDVVYYNSEDSKVTFKKATDSYTVNPNFYIAEGGKYYQLKQKEDGTGSTTATLLDSGWELTSSDDTYNYYKTIEDYIGDNEWAQFKVSWSGTTNMAFKFKSVCTDGDESYDYAEISKLDVPTFTENPRSDNANIAYAAIGHVYEDWQDYSVDCNNGEHSIIFIFSTDGKCDGDYAEIAVPKQYTTYLTKKGDEIPTEYHTQPNYTYTLGSVMKERQFLSIQLPNTKYVVVDSSDYKDVEKTISYEFVDLGITNASGKKVLWATCNIGAESPEEYGCLYQWGATSGYGEALEECKTYSTWAIAPFNGGQSSYSATEWAKVSGDVVTYDGTDYNLNAKYDVATVNMGSAYRLPTRAEYNLLTANTTSEWTSLNGVNGYRFTSKADTTKSVFFPAAGVAGNGSLNDVGIYGYVWSSSLNADGPCDAWLLYFDSGDMFVGSDCRYGGYSSRGVWVQD